MTAERKTRPARKISAMPVVLSDTPPGFDWGWYSREDPRMHLQVINPQTPKEKYKVWLETRGRRVLEPETPIKSNVLKAVRAAIKKNRQFIEDRWVSFLIRKGWLEAHLAPPKVTLVAYPRTPNTFTRIVDLTEDLLEEEARSLADQDIRLSPEMASLQIWPRRPADQRQDIRLSAVLWQG
jgi:hypothetical protein